MSESMSSPWIRDYIVGVAETHGAQIYDVPMSKGKKRVQLTDFLTYQEDSYVWAWVSDKDYRISARISKDAIDEYKRKYSRSIVDSRFFLVFISNYRPMFSPRPLGPNILGNTNVSHISLEIGQVSFIGMGWHSFGNPRELESDEKLKEWVLGLRQDGGGGNVLMLRKQQELVQNKNAPPSPPSPPPFSLYAPVSQYQNTKDTEDSTNSNPEKKKDFKRAYSKRWRKIEIDPWKLATKPPAEQQPIPTESGHPPAEPPLDSLEPCDREPLASRHRTPSPTPLHQQGTPTDWSPSNRGSPVVLAEVKNTVSDTAIQQHDEPDALPTTSHLLSATEWQTTVDATVASDTRSPQPPTPAQRIRRSLPPCASPPPDISSGMSARSPIISSQLPGSSPPPPSSSLPIPSSSLPIPVGIRKNIQRKVPHPGPPARRLDSFNQGPAQVLVPNSETSGTGSSQPYSQSSHPPASLPHISKELKPGDECTSREGNPSNPTRRVSKMLAESLPTHDDNERETTIAGDKHTTDKTDTNVGELEGRNPTRLPRRSAPSTKVLEVGTSDTEEEADVLQLTTAWMETRPAVVPETKDPGEENANADHENSQLSIDDADIHLTLQGNPPHRSPSPAIASVALPPSPAKETTNVPIRTPARLSERPGSQGSVHSLFSGSLDDERTAPSQAPISTVGRNEDEQASPADVPRHNSEAWKEPSFIAKHKGKNKARVVEGPDTPSVTASKRRRQRSSLAETPLPKRAKRSPTHQKSSDQATTRNQDREESELGKTHVNNQLAPSPKDITEMTILPQLPKPRLANFVVDFTRINLGKKGAIPRLDLDRDIKATLLRTGRIRTLGESVEKDGSVYIHS